MLPAVPDLRAAPPDASTLVVSCLNVGMNTADAFSGSQEEKLESLADIVHKWLFKEDDRCSVVGLNELHETLGKILVEKLRERGLEVESAQSDTNALLWPTP